jgi:tyrosine-protein phosphatase YwqE
MSVIWEIKNLATFVLSPNNFALFSFLNKKPFLKDLIPDGHVDIHSHILPGIDDGAKTIDDTAALIDGLVKTGCTALITTPHVMQSVWDNTKNGIEGKFSETKKLLEQRGINIPIRAAAEYLLDANFAEQFKTEQLLTLKDNYVLVEMSYINPPLQLFEFLFEMQVAGYVPVLAHPERYAFYHKSFDKYEKLKNAGCYFQVNLLSTVGYYGEGVFKAAEKLLKAGMIDFTGSDAHHAKHIASLSKRVMLKDTAPLSKAIANNETFRF